MQNRFVFKFLAFALFSKASFANKVPTSFSEASHLTAQALQREFAPANVCIYAIRGFQVQKNGEFQRNNWVEPFRASVKVYGIFKDINGNRLQAIFTYDIEKRTLDKFFSPIMRAENEIETRCLNLNTPTWFDVTQMAYLAAAYKHRIQDNVFLQFTVFGAQSAEAGVIWDAMYMRRKGPLGLFSNYERMTTEDALGVPYFENIESRKKQKSADFWDERGLRELPLEKIESSDLPITF